MVTRRIMAMKVAVTAAALFMMTFCNAILCSM